MLRYGPMRAQLRGIEAVLSDGTVVSHLAGLVKDNTGYHYPSLLAGSEGTLAFITAARHCGCIRARRRPSPPSSGSAGLYEVHAVARQAVPGTYRACCQRSSSPGPGLTS